MAEQYVLERTEAGRALDAMEAALAAPEDRAEGLDGLCGAILTCALPTNHDGLHERADGIRWEWPRQDLLGPQPRSRMDRQLGNPSAGAVARSGHEGQYGFVRGSAPTAEGPARADQPEPR